MRLLGVPCPVAVPHGARELLAARAGLCLPLPREGLVPQAATSSTAGRGAPDPFPHPCSGGLKPALGSVIHRIAGWQDRDLREMGPNSPWGKAGPGRGWELCQACGRGGGGGRLPAPVGAWRPLPWPPSPLGAWHCGDTNTGRRSPPVRAHAGAELGCRYSRRRGAKLGRAGGASLRRQRGGRDHTGSRHGTAAMLGQPVSPGCLDRGDPIPGCLAPPPPALVCPACQPGTRGLGGNAQGSLCPQWGRDWGWQTGL